MELTDLRREMDAIDRELLALFARRMALSGEIAGLKKAAALPVFDPAREEEKLRQAAIFHFRHFPLRIPVWVGFGSDGKVTEFSIGKCSENAEKSG